MDEYGYPTYEELEKISKWDANDIAGLMAYIKERWKYADDYWKEEGGKYYLSTAGWSGNESIIIALENNAMFWYLYAEQWRRGGHYIFGRYDIGR